MENSSLSNPEVYPSEEVLEMALGGLYPVFSELMNSLRSDKYRLNTEWRYYKDGKAWLCKTTLGKKTVAWISVWPDCFKLAFYFTEKSGGGIPGLNIHDSLKEFYLSHKPIGKLKPLVVETRQRSQLEDIFTLIAYKTGQL